MDIEPRTSRVYNHTGGKWGTECLNTRLPLPTVLYMGYSVKLCSFYLTYYCELWHCDNINKMRVNPMYLLICSVVITLYSGYYFTYLSVYLDFSYVWFFLNVLNLRSDTLSVINIDLFYCFRKKKFQCQKYAILFIFFFLRCLFILNTIIYYHYNIGLGTSNEWVMKE